jgi:hypothetical protein
LPVVFSFNRVWKYRSDGEEKKVKGGKSQIDKKYPLNSHYY